MEYDLTEIIINIKNKDKISISYIQRTFSYGFNKSNKIFHDLIEGGYIDAEVMAVDHYDLDGEDCDEDSEDFSDDIDSTVFTDEENSLFEHYNDALVRFLTIAEKLVSMKLITDTSIQNEFKEALGCFVEAKKKNEEYFK